MATILSILTPERHSQPWDSLLEAFGSSVGATAPLLRKLGNRSVPRPYRQLLVHSMDLTPTLEAFYRQTLALTVLSRRRDGTNYLREVVLRLAGSGRRVGYGVIRIALHHLPPVSARRVLEEQVPFGSILQTDGIPHLSWPQAFFCTEPNAHIRQVLGLQEASRLYGRRNVLLDGSRRLLAEVIEILAPVYAPPPEASPAKNGRPGWPNGSDDKL